MPNKKTQEKADYRFDFYKAKDVSDKIEDWLHNDVKLDWKELYYWKDIKQFEIKTNQGILKLGWQKVRHASFNREVTLLYKVESEVGSVMLKHKDDEIIEAEILKNGC